MPHEIEAIAVDGVLLADRFQQGHRVDFRQLRVGVAGITAGLHGRRGDRRSGPAPPPAGEVESHRREDDESVSLGEVGRAVEQDLLEWRDVQAVQIDHEGCRLPGIVGRRHEQRVGNVGVRFRHAVRAFENALLRRGEPGLGRSRDSAEAARNVGGRDSSDRRAVVVDVDRAGARVGAGLRDDGRRLPRPDRAGSAARCAGPVPQPQPRPVPAAPSTIASRVGPFGPGSLPPALGGSSTRAESQDRPARGTCQKAGSCVLYR